MEVEGRVIPCVLRGRLKVKETDFRLAAGDRVSVKLPDRADAAGTIEALEPRTSWLARYVGRDASARVIVANVETLFVVTTMTSPPIHYDFIDRVLVAAERGEVRSSIVLNKIDLVDEEKTRDVVSTYVSCGYSVNRTSALTGEGVDRLSDQIGEGVYAFVGESGVGKSSLLMKIDPGLDLKVRTLGGKTGRGRHTTAYSQLFRFGRGYLADTPGIQTFGFPGDDKTELPGCFPEFAAHEGGCRFSPCTHSHEPECGVKDALDSGAIHRSRYRSYLNILAEVEERERRPPR